MATETQRGSVIRQCEQCGISFSVFRSTLAAGRGQCCSKVCRDKLRLGKPAPKHKTRKDKKPEKPHVCQWCGKVFISKSHAGYDKPKKYCSNQCHGLSKRKDRKDHPRQKQASALLQWARAVILRDKACIRCGAREKLQAHHVESYAENTELQLDVGNGATLCPVCHHSQHPEKSLAWFTGRGGRTVQHCVVCESAYLPHKKSQRTCSPKCGCALRYGGYGDE